MEQRSERNVCDNLVFNQERQITDLPREHIPWPKSGESLLDATIGSEEFIYGYEEFVLSDLQRLSFYGMQYQECARDLIRLLCKTRNQPENIVYVIVFCTDMLLSFT